jgi:TonB-linked SusC/RagA family outer membrane protein
MRIKVFHSNNTHVSQKVLGIKHWLIVCVFFLCLSSVKAQTVDISGTVKDALSNESLPGASITIQGTSISTITDANGKYKLQLTDPNATLLVSYIGYTSEKVQVNGRTQVDISLVPEIKSMEEVVVIGYGTAKKRDLTGSVSSVKGDDLKAVPVATAAEAITGKIAGVQVTTTEGTPGADVKIRVRGGGSITQDNSPLYIIDGFPSDNGLAAVDPLDIESIDVLKDASSAAIYGARGANGVVIITTKRGSDGKTTVNFNGYWGHKKLAKKLDLLSPYEFALAQYENSRGTDFESGFDTNWGSFDQLYPVYSRTKGVDWQEEVFGRDAAISSQNITVNGGNKNTKVNLGFTRNKEEGILIETGYRRNIINLRLDHKASDKLMFTSNVTYSDAKIDGGGEYGSTGRLASAILYKPVNGLTNNEDLIDEDSYTPDKLGTLYSPITLQKNSKKTNFEKKLNINGSAEYEIIKGLTAKVAGGITSNNTRIEKVYLTESPEASSMGGPWGSIENDQYASLLNTNLLTYKKTIGDHDFSIMGGTEYLENKTQKATEVATKFPNDDIIIENMSLGTGYVAQSSSEETERLMSFFGRVNYSLKDKYIFQATYRVDGSSKFGSNNRYGKFPSASVAWRISDEAFLKDVQQVSNLKLRLSYGASGNNRIDNYSYAAKYSSTYYDLNQQLQNAVYQKTLPNPNLKWETTVSRNIGLDLGLFNSRVNVTADFYLNETKDLLLDADIPPSTGYTTQFQNIGKTQNKGMEFTVSTVNIKTEDFQWTTNFNISFNKNKVKALTTGSGEDYITAASGWSSSTSFTDYIVKVGEPVGLMYGYITDGFYTVDDFNYNNGTYTLKPGIAVFGAPEPGSIKMKDLGGSRDANGNPMVNAEDKTVIGNANPKHFGGINNTFTYKGFDLSVFINWSYGNDIYNANKIRFTSRYSRYQNSLAIMRERWRTVDEMGEVVTDPTQLKEMNKDAKVWKYNTDLGYAHSWAIEDGSFLRINNVTLGYTLPKKLTQKVSIQSLRVYATVYNLHVFTNYSGYDPEVDTKRKTPLTPGVDYSAYPKSKSVIFGVNLTL